MASQELFTTICLYKTSVLGPQCACLAHACGFISFSVLHWNTTKHVNNPPVQEANYNNERRAHLEWIFDLQAFQGHLGHIGVTWLGMGTHSSDNKNKKGDYVVYLKFLRDNEQQLKIDS